MTSTTEQDRTTSLVHQEEGLTFVWYGGHTTITVFFGDTEIGAINMSKEVRDFDLAETYGTLGEHMRLFREICQVFLDEHIAGKENA